HPGGAGDDRGEGAGGKPLGHVHGDRDHPHRDLHGRLHALHPARQDRRDLGGRHHPAGRRDLVRRRRRRASHLGPGLHLHRHPDHLDADRLRFRRRGAAGVAAAGTARLPVDLPPTGRPAVSFACTQGTWTLIGYGCVAAVLPVWLLLAPRDCLSTFLKIGTIVGLAIGILIVMPELKMPALTQFTDGTGPVWKGSLFPFLFITIACGAVSGFHALISSGTTPKLLANARHAPYIGYGGMLMESFVAIMAMVAAAIIDPGVYFAMNSPAAVIGTDAGTVARTVSEWGFTVTPEVLTATAADIGENSILSRAGGAPTLAVGIAQIFHAVIPGEGMMAFWYHF